MREKTPSHLIDSEGLCAPITDGPEPGKVFATLPDGRKVVLEEELLERGDDGGFRLPHSLERLAEVDVVIPVVQEEIHVSRAVSERPITIQMTVEERRQKVDLPLLDESVQIERVPVNRTVEEPPKVRQEGDTLVIPVLEEVLVVEKRLMVREEVRITLIRKARTERQEVTLRSENVHIREGKVEEHEPLPSPSQ
jgi:hypothetical protein